MPVRKRSPGSPHCTALLADMVGSRRFQGTRRAPVQHHFAALVQRLNQRFRTALLAPFMVSRGDEFQGLLREPTVLPDLLWEAENGFTDTELRFGIGYGRLDTPVGSNVLELDGPALHRAREAIEQAATAKRLGGVFAGFGTAEDQILNGIARVLRRQRERMSARQRQVVEQLREGESQINIAKRLRLTKQAISSHARAAGWDAYHEGELAWRAALTLSAGRISDPPSQA
jgi:hypothetical protein